MIAPILLDTCAAIWIANGDPVADAARAALDDGYADGRLCFVSAMTAWEVATLAARSRLSLAMPVETWFRRLMETPGMKLAEATPEVLIRSAALPGAPPGDPADRIIIATAREHGLTLMTRDHEILDYARQGHVAAMAC